MPRYEDDDDDDRPSRRNRRRYEDDQDEAPRKSRSKKAPETNGYAVTSMILGLVGFCVPLVCGILAMLFGVIGLNRAKVTGTGKGMAVAGMILGFVNGIIEPAVLGYGLYYGVNKTREAVAKKQAEIEAENKKWQDEEKARQKKADDEQRERARKLAEDARKREEAQKLAVQKQKEENAKREEESARKREEDRLKREMEAKERLAKQEEERKKRDEENKLAGEINTARQQIFVLENACRTYAIRTKGKPPATLQSLLTSPNGGPPLINDKTPLKDPWGKDYQYDPANKNQVGGLDPLVFTTHPKTGDKILALNRK